MQITVKTTQNKIHKIDVEPTESVGQLKAKIEAAHGYPAATQKVIYSGKILPDDKTIESCEVKEKDFFVLMVAKPKPTPTPKAELPSTSSPPVSAPAQTPPAAPPAAAASPASTESQAQPPATSNTTSASQGGIGDASTFLTGDALQASIANMVEMGFPRDQVLRAMRASFNNPDRAVEYLMTGIPAHLEAEAAPPPTVQSNPPAPQAPQSISSSAPPAAQTPAAAPGNQPQNLFQLAQQQQQRGGGAASLGASGAAGLPAGLPQLDPNNPQSQQLRELVQQNPALLQTLIQQLAATNPGMAQQLAQNPEMLMQILGSLAAGEDAEDGEGGGVPPGAQVISVTEEERAAIQRLEALGFPRQAAIQAYFACDKNEELAANFLFEGAFDED